MPKHHTADTQATARPARQHGSTTTTRVQTPRHRAWTPANQSADHALAVYADKRMDGRMDGRNGDRRDVATRPAIHPSIRISGYSPGRTDGRRKATRVRALRMDSAKQQDGQAHSYQDAAGRIDGRQQSAKHRPQHHVRGARGQRRGGAGQVLAVRRGVFRLLSTFRIFWNTEG
jgi:hypothetical protein